MSEFEGGVAVVTGAGSGLGAAMAERFFAAGMSVVVLDIDGDRAERQAESLRRRGGAAIARRVDVADRASLEAAARAVEDAFSGCTVLCANVGVQQVGALERLTEPEWRWVLDVNVLGVVGAVAAFLPLLRLRSGPRHILLTSSSSALLPFESIGAYAASKFAVQGYGETLRLELAPEGIGVSILFPAGMSTRHVESSGLARPIALGPAAPAAEDIEVLRASPGLKAQSQILTPEEATRNLLADLAANERYIVTHGGYRQEMAERWEDLLRAFDRAQTS